MLYKEYIKILSLSIHKVGSKANMEGVELSHSPVALDDTLSEVLKSYFLMAFKDNERYTFTHPTSIGFNTVYSYVKDIFANSDAFHEQSQMLAKYLYERSEHPNIKRGDFYTIYFKDCILDGETINAIGLFKSENKDTYIQINPVSGGFSVESHTGMNINKLDKGCLIFDINKDDGYIVCVVDNSNHGDAKYWINDFLQLKRFDDDYRQTEQAVMLCKSFISKLPSEYDKASKAVMMNKVIETLSCETTSIDTIAQSAFGDVGETDAFLSYADEYAQKQELSFKSSFACKAESINKRSLNSVNKIRLDNNFEIKIYGGEQYLQKGYDEESGLKYYTLFFEKEK